MERRSKTKVQNLQNSIQQVQQLPQKTKKIQKQSQEAVYQQDNQKNILSQLTQIFQASRNDSQLIYPWMSDFHSLAERVIGTNYIVIGPCQSGKYSIVRYAIKQFHKDVQQIIINCEISTTEHQFFCDLLNRFRQKFPKAQWPALQKDINKIIVNQNIQFQRLNHYLIKSKSKFVIIIRNGQHLIGFKKQSILYNLFQWMGKQQIKKIGGLVILSRQLLFTDRLQKRIKSRFCGNRLVIFRPENPQIYINILLKRIDFLLLKKVMLKHKALLPQKEKIYEQQKIKHEQVSLIKEQSQDENTKKNRSKSLQKASNKDTKLSTAQLKVQTDKIIRKYQKQQYIKDLVQYYKALIHYIPKQKLDDIKIVKYFYHKAKQFERHRSLKSKDKLQLFHQKTILSLGQQIQCLENLRQAISDNEQIKRFFKQTLSQNQIITIPFALRIFQHFLMTIDQSLLMFFSVNSLKQLILQFLKKSIQFQFPMNLIQCHSLENFNNVELLLLILIYKLIEKRVYPIKLYNIYKDYKKQLHKQILSYSKQSTSNRYPSIVIERAMERLKKSQAISYEQSNMWNSYIDLTFEKGKVKKGLENLVRQNKLPNIHIELLHELNIRSSQNSDDQVIFL